MENTGKKDVKKGPRIPGAIEIQTVKPGVPGAQISMGDVNRQSEVKHVKSAWFNFPPDYKPEKK